MQWATRGWRRVLIVALLQDCRQIERARRQRNCRIHLSPQGAMAKLYREMCEGNAFEDFGPIVFD